VEHFHFATRPLTENQVALQSNADIDSGGYPYAQPGVTLLYIPCRIALVVSVIKMEQLARFELACGMLSLPDWKSGGLPLAYSCIIGADDGFDPTTLCLANTCSTLSYIRTFKIHYCHDHLLFTLS
jgi:hypothetical protein